MRSPASLGQGRHGTLPPAWRRGWLAFVCAVLLAFVGQSFVVQTHVHLDEIAAATQAGKAGVRASVPTKDPAQCPICRESAHAGHYLPSTPPALIAPAAALALCVATTRASGVVLQRIRRWYSRGPPGMLHHR